MKRSCAVASLALILCGAVPSEAPSGLSEVEVHDVDSATAIVLSLENQAESLRNTLVNGLRAARDDQKKFIDHIVKMVAEERLPQALVYAAFRWATQQRPEYPFPYFKYAVRELARRKGINI